MNLIICKKLEPIAPFIFNSNGYNTNYKIKRGHENKKLISFVNLLVRDLRRLLVVINYSWESEIEIFG